MRTEAHLVNGMNTKKQLKWVGPVRKKDDFGDKIVDEFIDGRTCGRLGGWAIMTPLNWMLYGCGTFGTGFGQRYRRHVDAKGYEEWIKVEG